MTEAHGKFVWYELMTTDLEAAEKFYGDVMGWTGKDAGMPDMKYTLLSAGGTPVAGLMTMPEAMRSSTWKPGWMGHVGVDSVDASADAVKANGGVVHRGPQDIPGVGRFAVCGDPQGTIFSMFKASESYQPGPEAVPEAVGHIGWRELHSTDATAGFAFYSRLFGWTKGAEFDMGPMGVYQLFAHAGRDIGGMMNKSEPEPAPYWLYYVTVDGINAATARVKAGGGEILFGPSDVPGGMMICQCLDPQGGMFAILGPKD